MHVLLINQTFYPDVAATAQYASDLAATLVERGHEVTVIASRRSYTDRDVMFRERETWRGVRILRCWSSGFGKSAKWKRALDFLTFLITCSVRLLWTRRIDAIVALTSPPLVSTIGAAAARLRGVPFVYWVMDLNPDEAVAAGWLQPESAIARLLNAFSRFSLTSADQVIALDRFMEKRLRDKGVPSEKISVIPPWPMDNLVSEYDPSGAAEFRRTHRLDADGREKKFVVMYSGNHSPCHPLDTLMQAAGLLREDRRIQFCFIGGGSEYARVVQYAKDEGLSNITCLPYQPLNELQASLSAADLHAVVMGDAFVGIVHPCKVYNIKQVGAPFFCVGPVQSPIADLGPTAEFRHGDAQGLAAFIASAAIRGLRRRHSDPIESSREILLERLVAVIGGQPGARLTEPVRG